MRKILQKFKNASSNNSQQPDIRLQRTWVNTCFEIVICSFLLVLWISIAFKIVMSSDKPVPIHFDLAGNADNYGNPCWLLILGGVCTVVSIYYMIAAFRPTNMISLNVTIRNMQQVKALVYWCYAMAIEITLLCTSLVYNDIEIMAILFKLLLAIMLITALGIQILLKKLR